MRFPTSTSSAELDGLPCPFRAFEARSYSRSYYGIDRYSVGMTLPIHHNYGDPGKTPTLFVEGE